MKQNTIRNSFLLVLAALIWGTAFVFQNLGMDHVEPFTFGAARYLVGAAVLSPLVFLRTRAAAAGRPAPGLPHGMSRSALTGGLVCGTALTVASMLQQFGILFYHDAGNSTNVGKAGFITALYIVMVPILGLLFKKRCSPLIWVSIGLATAGMYLLSVTDGFSSVEPADLILLLSALGFSVQILCIDHFAPKCDGIALACMQFLTAGLLCMIPALFLEHPGLPAILKAGGSILYVGVLSTGVAYTLQILGQRGLNPALASMLMSLESVFSVLAGWILLHQKLSRREIAGCIVVFAAILLAQLPQTGNASARESTD